MTVRRIRLTPALRGLARHACAAATVSLAATVLWAHPVAAATSCGSGSLTVAQARAAVEFTRTQVRDAHVHNPLEKSDRPVQALAILGQSISNPLSAAALVQRINVALGEARDAHLRVELAPDSATGCATLPVTFAWTDDGLLAQPGGALPAGARIVSLAGRSLEQLEALASASVPHENIYWAHSTFAHVLGRADTIATLGLAAADGGVEVSYETAAGEQKSAHLKPATSVVAAKPWVSYEIDAATSTGVFRLGRCDPNDEFFTTLGAFMREVRQREIHKVAIDLRGNPGGDSAVALAVLGSLGLQVERGFSVDIRVSKQLLTDMPMFDPAVVAPFYQGAGLPAPAANAASYVVPGPMVLGLVAQRLGEHALEVVPGRSLYVLTDGGTFSSAALFAVLVRDNHLGTLVGEPTGNSATFNGSEIERPVPGIPYVLHLSTARLLRPDSAAGPAPTLIPDLRAPQTAVALGQGHDAALGLIRRL